MSRAEEASPARRILVVEDEPSLASTLSDRLEAEGFRVTLAEDGERALDLLRSEVFDLVILDVMLPGRDGFTVCRDLRAAGLSLPVLMLTARTEVVDRVLGLKIGADDYLTKPYDMAELSARVEALLRRGGGLLADSPSTYVLGDVRVDFRRAEVTRNGEEIHLSTLELKLLRYLVEHRGEVLSRQRLLDEVWGYDRLPVTRTVDVHIASLRGKIEANPARPELIVTVHGAGYKLR